MPQRNNAPTPSLNLQIPSMHDFISLDARIYLPEAFVKATTLTTKATTALWRRKLAVFAHPYAPLGGCYDDPVVLSVVKTLLREGWIVASFNFRGADGSKGKTTWTGKTETKDYASVVTWALAYVQSLPPPTPPPSPGLGGEVKSGEEPEEEKEPEEEMELLLGGYSYGSLIASRAPEIGNLLENTTNETPFSQAIKLAKLSGSRWFDAHSSERTSYSGVFNRAQVLAALEAEQNRKIQCEMESRKGSRKWKVVTRYLLVSPLLPPVSSFMMGFGAGAFWGAAKSIVGLGHHYSKQEGEGDVCGMDGKHVRVLAVYGDGDVFTGVRKYRKWEEKMVEVRGRGMFKGVEVQGAGHFWREESAMDGLLAAIRDWVR